MVEGGEKILTEKDLLFTDMDMDTRPEDIKFESRNEEGAPIQMNIIINFFYPLGCVQVPVPHSAYLKLKSDWFQTGSFLENS